MTARIASSSTRAGRIRRGTRPQLVWIVLAGLLVAALLGAIAVGARLLREDTALVVLPTPSASPQMTVVPTEPLAPAYEAVFVRFAEATGLSEDIVVIAVDAQGNERELVQLPTDERAGAGFRPNLLTEGAAFSTTGLLAIPRSIGSYRYHWEIFDLNSPNPTPLEIAGITQDFDHRTPNFEGNRRPSPFWGPADEAAIPWYNRGLSGNQWHISFVDGRSGSIETVDVLEHPDDASDRIVPYWAADQSGILMSTSAGPRHLLRDGRLAEPTVEFMSDGHSRPFNSNGVAAPSSDDNADGPLGELLANGRQISDIAWSAAGDGLWLALSSSDETQVVAVSELGGLVESTALVFDPGPTGAIRVDGHLIGLAPDDSMIVLSSDPVMPAEVGEFTQRDLTPSLLVPETGGQFDVEGSFAGWLEVTP
ncbi:MAG TPA: hypothetical protein VEX62_05770 [Candidatus Limnocylindrales bacterium]|nr:hypothetical protein [Candidatus Limnocylindrales bacterium]